MSSIKERPRKASVLRSAPAQIAFRACRQLPADGVYVPCCRDQLRRSLATQTQGRKALDEMRGDCERLTRQLAAARMRPSSHSSCEEASDTAGGSPRATLCMAAKSAIQAKQRSDKCTCSLHDVGI